jgi:hypothetical protein
LTGKPGARARDDASTRGAEQKREAKLNPQDEVEIDIESVSEREFIEDVEEQETRDDEDDEEEEEEDEK